MSSEGNGLTAAEMRRLLARRARERGENVQRLLTQYAIERLLFRLSRSAHRNRLILKGAMLFHIWADQPHRPTRDLDFLGFGEPNVADFERTFRELCAVAVVDDGVIFKAETVHGELMKANEAYAGVRLRLAAELGSARLMLHVDIGFGDAVTPVPEAVAYPTLLDLPAPVLRIYPRETVVAEKFEAMVKLGLINSRMKDFYDIWMLARQFPFAGQTLSAAIRATFARRAAALPADAPAPLSAVFVEDLTKQAQWRAFIQRGALLYQPPPLQEVIADLGAFLLPPVAALRHAMPFTKQWPAGGPWV